MNLFKASNQWANRPVDETFWGFDDALAAAREMRRVAGESHDVPYSSLRVEADADALRLVGDNDNPAFPTHSATQQLCARAKVPHGFVSRQPATLAAQNINWGLKERAGENGDDKCELLFHCGDRLVLRAITSDKYERFWHADFLARSREMLGTGWRVPPAYVSPSRADDPRIRKATAEDVAGIEGLTSIQVGDTIGPAGMYMSDKDLFLFVVSHNAIDGPSGPLSRFAYAFNNEVGTGSWGYVCGMLDHVCGNHIVWGAKGVREVRVRHIGDKSVADGMRKAQVELREYNDSAASLDEAGLKRAATFELGGTKEEVVEAVFGFARKNRVNDLSEKRITAAYDRAEQVGRYGAPNTPWAISSGLTELSQETEYANERAKLDRAAGRVLEIAF